MNMTVLMAQLLEAQQTLLQEQERANLLSAIAQVANLLLRSPNYATVSPAVVKLLGEAVGSDRCCLTQEVTDPTTQKVAVKFVAEYTTRGIPSKFNNPEYQEAGEIDEVPPSDLQSRIGKGESVNFLVSELPDCSWKSLFEAQQCTSLLIVPIMVSGQCWGAIGFDNCRKPRLHDKAEIEILQVAADSIAAAIERQAKDDELRRSEALYRSLFEISNEGIWRWTLDRPISMGLPIEQQVEQLYQHYSVVQANNTFAEMFGFAKGEDVVRWRLINSHLQKSDKNQVMMRTYVENGHHARNLETEEVDSQGCKRYFLNSVISFTENHHIIIGGWGTQIDITELREAQQALLEAEQAKSHLLTTVTTIANQILRSSDYTKVLPTVLQLLGESARADRCSLVQNITDPYTGKPAVKLHAEWCRLGIQPSIVHNPALKTALLWEDFPEVQTRLSRNEPISFAIAELAEPARSLLLDQGNVTMSMVPIMVEDEFWGVFGFDYCTETRSLNDEEMGIYAIAVDSIAAAIEHQRSQQALLQAAQNRTAELAKANHALKKSLDSLATEPSLDKFLGQVLEAIAEQFNSPLAEYWYHPENTAFIGMMSWHGQIYNQQEIAQLQPNHPGIAGFNIQPELINCETPHDRKQYFIADDMFDRPYIDSGLWAEDWERIFGNLRKHINVPLVLGDDCIGALVVRMPRHHPITTQQIELAQALAHQATLAVRLTQLAEAAKQAAIAREQEKAAQERAIELAKANAVIKQALSVLTSEPELNHFLAHVLAAIAEQMQSHSSALWLFDNAVQTATLHLVYENSRVIPAQTAPPSQLHTVELDDPDWASHLTQRQPYLLNVLESSVFTAMKRAYLTSLGVKAVFVIPLLLGDRAVGSFSIRLSEIREVQPIELELAQALAHQTTLALQLTQLVEQNRQAAILNERNRMARDIHDTLAQGLTGIVVHLEGADNVLSDNPEKARSRLDRARQLARESLSEARRSVHALRPQSLESADLCAAIRQLIEQMTEDTPLHVQLECEALADRLSPNLESHLLRITQEALTNTIKHAAASQVSITLSVTSEILRLSIHDDGQGFEVDSNLCQSVSTAGFGLIGMRDRVRQLQGQFSLKSQLGGGTTIEVIISNPFSNEEKQK